MRKEAVRYIICAFLLLLLTVLGSSVTMDMKGTIVGKDGKAAVSDQGRFEGVVFQTDKIMFGPDLTEYYAMYVGNYPEARAVSDSVSINEIPYLIYKLYVHGSGREPDYDGFDYWCSSLEKDGNVSMPVANLLFNAEVGARHWSNEEFVKLAYWILFERDPEPDELEKWKEQLDYKCSREHMVSSLLQTKEFAGICAKSGLKTGDWFFEPDEWDEWKTNVSVLEACNKRREEAGLPKLVIDENLWWNVAQVRTNELNTDFSHNRPDGTPWFIAYDAAGNIPYSYAAEGIAEGYSGGASAAKAWFKDPELRASFMHDGEGYMAAGFTKRNDERPNYFCVEVCYP